MIPLTATKIARLIQEAEAAGVPKSELQELREKLAEIKTGKLEKRAKTMGLTRKEIIRNGKKVIRVSTSPSSLDEDDDEDLERVSFRPVNRRSIPLSED